MTEASGFHFHQGFRDNGEPRRGQQQFDGTEPCPPGEEISETAHDSDDQERGGWENLVSNVLLPKSVLLTLELLACTSDPIGSEITALGKMAVFITEDYDVLFEDHKQIADLFAVALSSESTLISKNSRIAP